MSLSYDPNLDGDIRKELKQMISFEDIKLNTFYLLTIHNNPQLKVLIMSKEYVGGLGHRIKIMCKNLYYNGMWVNMREIDDLQEIVKPIIDNYPEYPDYRIREIQSALNDVGKQYPSLNYLLKDIGTIIKKYQILKNEKEND
jgi:hypothetical protein